VIPIVILLASAALLVGVIVVMRVQRRRRIRREAPAIVMAQLQKRIADLRAELEVERMRVVACGVAALGVRSVRITSASPYWSPSHEDVCKLADREERQRELLTAIAERSCTAPPHAAAAHFLGLDKPVEDFWATKGLHLPPAAW